MADWDDIWIDLTGLGFGGWEASPATVRPADSKGGLALCQAVRPVGSKVQIDFEGKDGLALWTRLRSIIEGVEQIRSRSKYHYAMAEIRIARDLRLAGFPKSAATARRRAEMFRLTSES